MNTTRNDDILQKKWSGKRIVRDEFNRWEDPGIDFKNSPSLTDHSQAAECDVNRIVDRYMKTGILPGADIEGVYGDYSSVPDYLQAQQIIANAQQQFDGLSPDLRKRFENDPEKFLDFVHDPKNKEEMKTLGLLKEAPINEPQEKPKKTEPKVEPKKDTNPA